jgi:DNA-binding MarR family transcriptional regulator
MTPRASASFPANSGHDEAVIEDSIARVIAGWRATRPELAVEPIAITARLARLQAVLGPRLETVFARFGLRGADFAVIATLVRLEGENVAQRRLASELGLSAGTVSLRIDRLVQRGLVDRRPDPDDGRGALVSLTSRGRELFEGCADEHLANAAEQLAGLSGPERDQLGQLLAKLLYTLEDPGPGDQLASELGLVVDDAPVALERRRVVGLPALAGLLVRHVDPAGPGAAGGIRPGDLLTAANGQPLRNRHDLHLALNQSRRRDRAVTLKAIRGAEPLQLRLTPPRLRSSRDAAATGKDVRLGGCGSPTDASASIDPVT